MTSGFKVLESLPVLSKLPLTLPLHPATMPFHDAGAVTFFVVLTLEFQPLANCSGVFVLLLSLTRGQEASWDKGPCWSKFHDISIPGSNCHYPICSPGSSCSCCRFASGLTSLSIVQPPESRIPQPPWSPFKKPIRNIRSQKRVLNQITLKDP